MNRIEIFRLFLFVREPQGLGQNRGQRVEAIQHWSGGEAAHGTSWCAWLCTMVLDLEWQGESPIPRMGNCQEIRERCEQLGYMVTDPEPGDLFFYVDANGHAHHIGVVTSNDPLEGIAGNTDASGTSNNGDRCAEHAISATHFARVPAP